MNIYDQFIDIVPMRTLDKKRAENKVFWIFDIIKNVFWRDEFKDSQYKIIKEKPTYF